MPTPTQDDWARIRFAYEHSDRPVGDICATYGISTGTLRDRVRRWNWTRRRLPISPIGPAPLTHMPAMTAPTLNGLGDRVRDAQEDACEHARVPQMREPAVRQDAQRIENAEPKNDATINRPALAARPVARTLDHDDFGSNRSKIMNVIDSNILERDVGGKPLHTFPHPALEAEAGPLVSASPPIALDANADTAPADATMDASLTYSRFIAQEAKARGETADAAPLSGQLRGAIARIMPAIERTLATLAAGPLQPRQMELTARSLGALTRTLRELNGLLAQHAADEWEPTDMEEFRRTLAARIEAMIREREEETPRIYHAAWEEFAAQVRAGATSEGGEQDGPCVTGSVCKSPPSS